MPCQAPVCYREIRRKSSGDRECPRFRYRFDTLCCTKVRDRRWPKHNKKPRSGFLARMWDEYQRMYRLIVPAGSGHTTGPAPQEGQQWFGVQGDGLPGIVAGSGEPQQFGARVPPIGMDAQGIRKGYAAVVLTLHQQHRAGYLPEGVTGGDRIEPGRDGPLDVAQHQPFSVCGVRAGKAPQPTCGSGFQPRSGARCHSQARRSRL